MKMYPHLPRMPRMSNFFVIFSSNFFFEKSGILWRKKCSCYTRLPISTKPVVDKINERCPISAQRNRFDRKTYSATVVRNGYY